MGRFEPISGKQIHDFIPDAKIIEYLRELESYNTIDELLAPNNKVVILYNSAEDFGHWVALFKYNNTIQFFDSYGTFPDDQRKYTPKEFLKKFKQIPHLTKLLLQHNGPVRYNQYRLQDSKSQTCGRWVILRLMFPELNEDEFYTLFKDIKNKDDYITNLTKEIL